MRYRPFLWASDSVPFRHKVSHSIDINYVIDIIKTK